MHQMLTQLKLARIREIHQDWLDRAAETQNRIPTSRAAPASPSRQREEVAH